MKLDSFGNAHVAHVDSFEGVLHYSFWDRKLHKWFTTDVSKGGAFCTLVLDSKQHPHISTPAGTGVMHSYWDGTKWQTQFANVHARVINYFTSITLDAKDNPSITFYEEAGAGENWGRLRIVVWNGSYWDLKTVDSDHGSGKFNSMATDSKGYQEIAYGNVEYAVSGDGGHNVSLRYARFNGQTWVPEILERTDTSKWSVNMVLDSKDVPHITYTDVSNHLIKYATQKAGNWVFEAVDTIALQAYPDRNGIALDNQGEPYISYYDAGAGTLKVAHRVNGKWLTELVDRDFAGYTSSIQVSSDEVFLIYSDEPGTQLKFARRSLLPPVPPPPGKPQTAAK